MSSETPTDQSFPLGNPFLEEFNDSPFSYLYDGSCDSEDDVAAVLPVAEASELRVLDIIQSLSSLPAIL